MAESRVAHTKDGATHAEARMAESRVAHTKDGATHAKARMAESRVAHTKDGATHEKNRVVGRYDQVINFGQNKPVSFVDYFTC